MNLKPEQLEANGYQLIDRLDHKELIPFIRTYMRKPTWSSRIYVGINLIIIAVIIIYFAKGYVENKLEYFEIFIHFFYGFAIAFLLIPIHEIIHALAYKSQGAENTSFDANLKKFYFLAIADKFVANKREFQIIALAPFVVITLVLLSMLPFVGEIWIYTILGTLSVHTACCWGDFGLISFYEFNKGRNIVTFDNKTDKISYFYENLS
jgi:hypothetical protein